MHLRIRRLQRVWSRALLLPTAGCSGPSTAAQPCFGFGEGELAEVADDLFAAAPMCRLDIATVHIGFVEGHLGAAVDGISRFGASASASIAIFSVR
jgi:hypothetical protein